jgi:uncharacterized membrane protein
MARYDLYLFVHVVAAIVWLGAGLLIQIQAHLADRAQDAEGLRRAAGDGAALGTLLFIPASLTVLVFGLLMVLDGPWGFDTLWVDLGLAGYLATFLTGILVMKPGSERIAAMMERDGAASETALLETRRLLVKGRVDTLVLYLVVAVMTLKPTGDDVALLGALGALVAGGLGLTVLRLRALEAPQAADGALLAR